ncbi:hypothetical protein NDU88_005613 [Pleurodeles waltl]|uniref:3'5'-cyclic nucleotide phosphodiesterase PDE8 domain-containing protein n=1 Tax=Pleurodeles waltl TaxID=8319 RepID=A0AAV7TXS8_PLEWA|nr:hypothetical protein NDU88_005613 [Pleurodeles waltl]
MGCAPSIHISDSRVVYHSGKDSEDSAAPREQDNQAPGAPVKPTSTYKLRTPSYKKGRGESMEADTRISGSSVKVKAHARQLLPLKLLNKLQYFGLAYFFIDLHSHSVISQCDTV